MRTSTPRMLMIDSFFNGLESNLKAAVARQSVPKDTSLLEWGKRFFPHYFTKDPGEHHIVLSQKMENRDIRSLVLIAPRNSAKSTYISFLRPLKGICEETERFIILVGDTYSQAVKYLKAVRSELEDNAELARVYPFACGRGKEWNDEGILTNNGIRVEPLGTGQKIRGRRERNWRPSLVVVDDPEGDDVSYSAITRQHNWEWFTKGLLKVGDSNTCFIVGGTVIHRDCLVGKLATLPRWYVCKFRSILDWPKNLDLWSQWEAILRDVESTSASSEAERFYQQHKDAMEEGARVLWPANEPLKSLMEMRASGHASFEAEKQNNPIDPSKCEWGEMFFNSPGMWFDEWPADLDVRVSALDPSKGKQDQTSDWQAMVDVGIRLAPEKVEVFIDSDLSKRHLTAMCAEFVRRVKDFRADAAVVESNQFQELLLPDLEAESSRQGSLVPISGTNNSQNKRLRIQKLGSYVNKGCLRFKRCSRGNSELIKQLIEFPHGDHDDGPDALEMAMRQAQEMLCVVQASSEAAENPY